MFFMETTGSLHELYLQIIRENEGLQHALEEQGERYAAATDFIASQQTLIAKKNAGIRKITEAITMGDLPIALDTCYALLPEGLNGQ
jgi:hypothetical protein